MTPRSYVTLAVAGGLLWCSSVIPANLFCSWKWRISVMGLDFLPCERSLFPLEGGWGRDCSQGIDFLVYQFTPFDCVHRSGLNSFRGRKELLFKNLFYICQLNPSTPKLKKHILPTRKEKCVSWVVRIGSIIIFLLSKLWKANFFMLCDVMIFGKAAGEIWNWSLWDKFMVFGGDLGPSEVKSTVTAINRLYKERRSLSGGQWKCLVVKVRHLPLLLTFVFHASAKPLRGASVPEWRELYRHVQSVQRFPRGLGRRLPSLLLQLPAGIFRSKLSRYVAHHGPVEIPIWCHFCWSVFVAM